MRSLTSREIRSQFLDFFAGHGHQVVDSSSLLPAGDPSLIFANAGMNQFKEVFVGREQRPYSRACSTQKCVRAGGKHNDLENVGYTARHHTFFEMLGNFSFGDYFKREAVQLAWELLLDVWGLPLDRLWFTVYTDDDEGARCWEEVGAPRDRILRFGESENFWSMGEVGPCGPCSEIHFDRGPDPFAAGRAELVNGPGDAIIEIWNLVFMQFERDGQGNTTPLPNPSVDTGLGLERMAAVLQGVETNYDTDLFAAILAAIGDLVGRPYKPEHALAPAYRVIADHIRAATFLLTDGVVPSSEGRGYVLRRIIRRGLRYGRNLGLDGAFLHTLVPVVINEMGDIFRDLQPRQEVVTTQLRQEEERFSRTLNSGTDLAQKELERIKRAGTTVVPGERAFQLWDTHGIPVELFEEFAQEEGLSLDREGFDQAMKTARERSQTTWKGGVGFRPEYDTLVREGDCRFVGYDQLQVVGEVRALLSDEGQVEALPTGASGELVLGETPFYAAAGGQIGDQGEVQWQGGQGRITDTSGPLPGLIIHHLEIAEGSLARGVEVTARVAEDLRSDTQRNHTATHLLHAALHQVLGEAAQQAGSLVDPDRLRFDFNWGDPVSFDDLQRIERFVNSEIAKDHPVDQQLMEIAEARKLGAMALFGEKYGDTVRVITIGDGISVELCGGCHVRRTGEIGLCRLISERGVAAGVRRIEALTGRAAVESIQHQAALVHQLSGRYHTSFEQLPELLDKRDQRLADLEEEVRTLKHRLAAGETAGGEARTTVKGIDLLARRAPEMSPAELRNLADTLRQKLGSGVVVLGMEAAGKATLLVAVTEDLAGRVHAGNLVRELAKVVGGRGGGRPNLAQAGGPHPEKIDEALKSAPATLEAILD